MQRRDLLKLAALGAGASALRLPAQASGPMPVIDAHIHLFDSDTLQGVPCIISGGAGSQLAWFGYAGDAMYHLVIVDVVKGKVSYRVERFDTELMP